MTPHPKELQRLIGDWKDDFDKLKKVEEFTRNHDVILVLKGSHTFIFGEGNIYINNSGNPGMATAGSGDVLSGIISGLISQQYQPLVAAILGVYLHGLSGDIVAENRSYQALISGDIAENMGAAFQSGGPFTPNQYFDINVKGTFNILEACSTNSNLKHLIVTSTDSTISKYPEKMMNNPIGEFDLPQDVTEWYGYSKILAEGVLNHLSVNGLKCIVLRPSSLYGYGLPSDKLIQNYINIASSSGVIQVTGSRNKVNFIHAYDVSNAAWQAYLAEAWGVFNISSNAPSSILEIAEIAVSISKGGSISILDESDNDGFVRFNLNSDSAKKHFEFNPVINLRKGMTLMKNKMVSLC